MQLKHRFAFRMADVDRGALYRMAAEADITPAAFLRHLLRERARQAGVMPAVGGEVSAVRTDTGK